MLFACSRTLFPLYFHKGIWQHAFAKRGRMFHILSGGLVPSTKKHKVLQKLVALKIGIHSFKILLVLPITIVYMIEQQETNY